MLLFLFILALSAIFAAGEPSTNVSSDWPQWRGPTRDGKLQGPTWPGSLQREHLSLRWRVPLGPGYPGPIIAADRVFVAETEKQKNEVVRALDRATGKEIWLTRWPGSMSVPFFARENGSWIRSTPAFDGDSLYVAGMRDVLVCLNARTGKERWSVDFVQKFGTDLPAFGFVCSPLVDGDAVYVQAGASLVKLDKRSGEVLWRSLQDGVASMMASAFSSPVIATIGGRRQLVVQTRQKLAGADLETGKILWSKEVPAFRGMNILTPTVVNDSVFTSAYGGKSFLFRIGPQADGWKVQEAWANKTQGYMSSPIVIGDHCYLHLRNQRATCIDLKTGKERWITTERFGKYWSMVAQGDRILALDERGILYLLKADPEKFTILDERKISEAPTWGHLAVSGDELFIRELEAIAVYRWR